MRSSVILNETVTGGGVNLVFTVALWVPVPAALQEPNLSIVSQVPLASANGANKWGTDGITGPELGHLQDGTYDEQIVTMSFPLRTFTDLASASQLDALYTAAVATLAASVPPTGENYIGSSSQVTTVTAGAALPVATIAIAALPSTPAVPAAGVVFIPSSTGMNMVNYTGTTANSLTGCTGGTGNVAVGANVWFYKAG